MVLCRKYVVVYTNYNIYLHMHILQLAFYFMVANYPEKYAF